MASSRKRVRYTFDINFSNHEEKEAFQQRLKKVRQLLTPVGCPPLDNYSLFNTLCDALESASQPSTLDPSGEPSTKSFLRSSGLYTDEPSPEEPSMFITEKHCFSDLLAGLSSPCPCGMTRSPWTMDSLIQRGHVVRASFSCRRCRHQKRLWSSSRVFGGHYLVNQKMVHGFTCAGILPSQYMNLNKFANIGSVCVYQKRGYAGVVAVAAEKSMQAAVHEAKALPHYSTKGEWIVTVCRHDATASTFRTTVPCLSGSTRKILGISTISRKEQVTAETREFECTKMVIPQVQCRGLDITEVAHDVQAQVSNYVSVALNLVDSYDTWHGTKNVAKEMEKISDERVRDGEKNWFPELEDKWRSIKMLLYWAMKDCNGCPSKLREFIMNIPNHYKGDHSGCPSSSYCRIPAYTPSRNALSNPNAEKALLEHLQATCIYRNAEAFCRCRDTYWVESLNHALLTYVPRRVHLSATTFEMRMNLAVMDWNENVNREYKSLSRVRNVQTSDRCTALKVLVKKTFSFVDTLWAMYVKHNKADLSEIADKEEAGVGGDDCGMDDGLMILHLDSSDESVCDNEDY